MGVAEHLWEHIVPPYMEQEDQTLVSQSIPEIWLVDGWPTT